MGTAKGGPVVAAPSDGGVVVKGALRRLMSGVLVRSGATTLGRRWGRPDGAVILYSHRIADDDEGYLRGLAPAHLDDQLAYLTRHYEIISLDDLVGCFESGKQVPPKSAVLTFDDGFRDNLEAGLPLFQKHGVTATVFVVTGALSSGALPWSQRLGYMLQKTELRDLRYPSNGADVHDLSTPAGREITYRRIKRPLRSMGRAERERVLDELTVLLRVVPPTDRMLDWEMAHALRAAGIAIGAHTYSHPLLAEIPIAEAREEMERSRDDLRERLGIEHPHFCFPGGSLEPELLRVARGLGFRSAFRPNQPRVRNALAAVDQFTLARRWFADGPAEVLEAELDGPVDALRSLVRGPMAAVRRARGTN